MIVVVGSRHDPVAMELVATWPGAALCSAEDLVSPGWAWTVGGDEAPTWVVGGRTVADSDVTGVFLRRSAVYPAELLGIHPDDRTYMASEAHAFLIFVLASTRARVASPVADGGLGDDALRPEQWMPLAAAAGLPLAPLHLRSGHAKRRALNGRIVEVVDGQVIGDMAPRRQARIHRFVAALRLDWAQLLFDGRQRLVALTSMHSPTPEAATALGRMLMAGAPS
ncbi:hypothetical protein [Pseudomonas indica]|uniref:hypothetical protein n=1 Tax=Pseudomonas indica TaxID=137658 RepID=UPI0023F9E4FE|nr:hypothetical protein [Pseudomonas indica]MBU3056564.1 hypothetical protein [Pseudomonas indica]